MLAYGLLNARLKSCVLGEVATEAVADNKRPVAVRGHINGGEYEIVSRSRQEVRGSDAGGLLACGAGESGAGAGRHSCAGSGRYHARERGGTARPCPG